MPVRRSRLQRPKPAAAAAQPGIALTNGAALFKRHCVMCHGAAGLGDGPAAKTLKGKLPSLADKATHVQAHRRADSRNDLRRGRKPKSATCPLSASASSPEEITDIVNFVRTLAK